MKEAARYLQDMEEAIVAIQGYLPPSYEDFLQDEKTQDAIMFNLVVLGEAANKLPEDFQDKHTEIPWSSIIGTRNVIVHGYDQVKLQIVWDIITKNLQPLKETLNEIIKQY